MLSLSGPELILLWQWSSSMIAPRGKQRQRIQDSFPSLVHIRVELLDRIRMSVSQSILLESF